MFTSHIRSDSLDADNQLLAALPRDVRAQLEPDLTRVELAQGRTLQEAGLPLKFVYFPSTAVVSLVSDMQDGGSAEVAVVGQEGVVGVCACMGGGNALSGGVVQTAGFAWRMGANVLARHAARQAPVMAPLMRYTQALFVQLAQNSACNRHHSLLQQLCRWLLQHQDRQQGHDLLVTQERIAQLLGARRETITACAQTLQKSGLIRYARGHLAVLDRQGLEDHSCECYGVVKSVYDELRDGSPPARPMAAEMALLA
jgi:CRP-like cAMP-binding protein